MREKHYIGIDMGGTNLKGGIVSSAGNILFSRSIPIFANRGGKFVLRSLLGLVDELIMEAKKRKKVIKAIGIGTPGAVDAKKGCVCFGANNLPGWKGIPFVKNIEKRFKVRVFAHNDATLAALAEARFGVARKKKHIVCITLGTGIGGGIIIDGSVYDGCVGYAGEIGHMKIVPGGRACSCGMKGCWEAYASATAVIKTAKKLSQRKNTSRLYKEFKGRWAELEAKDVFRAANNNDRISVEVIKSTGFYLGVGLSNLVNIFNPEVIVLSGGMSRARSLRKAYYNTFKDLCMRYSYSSVKVVISRFKNNAGILGASAWAMENSK